MATQVRKDDHRQKEKRLIAAIDKKHGKFVDQLCQERVNRVM